MNYFERELRKIVGCCEYIRNPKYVGRACVGRLDDDIVVKMEFESTMIRDKYNALRVTLMNRSECKIDSQLIRFNELWGVKHIRGDDIEPHIWKYNEDVNWYCYIPTTAEMSELSQFVDEYLSCFTKPEMEETEEMEYQYSISPIFGLYILKFLKKCGITHLCHLYLIEKVI